ncbi:MAG: type II/IV secretion system ATPase subunit [Thermoprotei archaeon]
MQLKLIGNDSSKVLNKVNIRKPFSGYQCPPHWRVVERYALDAPFAYAVIAENESSSEKRYFLDELPLSDQESSLYSALLDALEYELNVPRTQVEPRSYFKEQAEHVIKKYSLRAPPTSWLKIHYFAERDLVGFDVLDGLLKDPNIEDISIDGLGKPVFVYHRRHESLGTNILIDDGERLDNLISKLAHMAGKHVSTAFPIVQGTLPGNHRLMATYRKEISPHGGSLTIRKFRADPITVIDMISMNVLDSNLAAYFWLLMENRATSIVVGATGSGKTTLMNALLTLTRMNTKIVTIEEVQEINIPHTNWTPLVARENYATVDDKARQVGMFELVKAAMRMRPDILVVGEVRGEEAYVLFQAISTGHGGMCTLHADDASSAIQRLTSKPMDVPPAFIPFLDLVLTVRRVSVPASGGGFKAVRRVLSVDEIMSVGSYTRMYTWDPTLDRYIPAPLKNSVKLSKLSKDLGVSMVWIAEEIGRRSRVLKWAQQKGIRNFKEVSVLFDEYRASPDAVYQRAVSEIGAGQEEGTPELWAS